MLTSHEMHTRCLVLLLLIGINCSRCFRCLIPRHSSFHVLTQRKIKQRRFSTSFLAHDHGNIVETRKAKFTLKKTKPDQERRRWWRRSESKTPSQIRYDFEYEYNDLFLNDNDLEANNENHTAILFIHPIGVGISKWFYNRLFNTFYQNKKYWKTMSFVAPDLLMSDTASSPTTNTNSTLMIPLLAVEDWADQLESLMEHHETNVISSSYKNVSWCIVSNGGCIPIALEMGKRQTYSPTGSSPYISNIILSAPPSLSSLLAAPPNARKLQKSYRRLCGIIGNVFWWYALRNNGKFIQKFSEKNLASSPTNLGEDWTPTCVNVAKSYHGQSRFSTFAFLAGSLEGGNRERFDALKSQNMKIGVIRGGDTRKNPARSWFWERSNIRSTKSQKNISEKSDDDTLSNFLKQNGNVGNEVIVGGRRCPAHEDPDGFASALIELLKD